MKKLATMFLLSFVIAWGSSDGGDADATVGGGADANPNQPDAMVQANCLAVNDVGSPALAQQAAQFCGTIDVPTFVSFAGLVNADAQPDALGIELYGGFGVFSAGIAVGTYPLTGAELDYATCGACVLLLTDWTGTAFADDGYMATGGSITIDTLNPIAGSVSGISFQHVNIDGTTFASTPHPDGCTSALTAASFSATATMSAQCQ